MDLTVTIQILLICCIIGVTIIGMTSIFFDSSFEQEAESDHMDESLF